VAALAVLGTLAVDAAAAGPRPDLTLTTLAPPPALVSQGAPLEVAYRIKNRGRSRARRSTTRFYLSRDRRRSGDDPRLASTRVKALKPRKGMRREAELTIPAGTPPGAYYLIACADGTRRINEARERNNCRVSRAFTLLPAAIPPGPGPTTGGGSAPPVPPVPPGPSGPLDVGIQLDTARSVTKRLGAAGGSISVTAANGTKLTLALPADALVGDVDITVTPLAGIDGLPFSGGLVGAVDLAPSGLLLQVPGTLTIEPAGPLPVDQQAPFGYLGNGQDFHSAPTTLDPGSLELPISHFSGGGAARGTEAERDAQQQRTPRDSSARTAQDLAGAIGDLRDGKIDRNEFNDLVEQVLRERFVAGLRPLMEAAKTDDSLALTALQQVRNWVMQVETAFGLTDRFAAEIDEAHAAEVVILRNAFDKAHERCLAHDVSQVARIIALSRIGQIEGIDLPDANQKIDECLRFELDFEAIIGWEVPQLQMFNEAHVRVQDLEIRWDSAAPGLRLRGEKELEYVGYDRWDEGTCVQLLELKTGAPFKVIDLNPDPNVYEDPNQPREIVLLIAPGTSAEQFDANSCSSPTYITRFAYYAGFANVHAAEHDAKPCPDFERHTSGQAVPPQAELPGFTIRGFDAPSGSLFGRASFDRRVQSCDEPSAAYDGITDFLLWHRPAS
jgi:CARDB